MWDKYSTYSREASSTAREVVHKSERGATQERKRCYTRERKVVHKSKRNGTQERENAWTLESANQRLPYSAVSPSTGLTTASTDEQHLGERNTKIQQLKAHNVYKWPKSRKGVCKEKLLYVEADTI